LSNHEVSRDLQVNYAISFYFHLYLVLYTCAERFDATENLEKFLVFGYRPAAPGLLGNRGSHQIQMLSPLPIHQSVFFFISSAAPWTSAGHVGNWLAVQLTTRWRNVKWAGETLNNDQSDEHRFAVLISPKFIQSGNNSFHKFKATFVRL